MILSTVKKWCSDNLRLTSRNYPTLDRGDVDPKIFGTDYSQSLLKQIYSQTKGKETLLTLTPICDYQIKNKWPEPPFVNVNLPGSRATEKANWLGYIPMDDPLGIDFEDILKKMGNVNVVSNIHKNGSEYWIEMHISGEYKRDEKKALRTYISHDEKEIGILEKIAHNSGDNYIKVDMKKSRDEKYEFYYNRRKIGTASIKKIDNCIGENTIEKLFLKITHFRFTEDNEHFSSLIIFIE